jgi:hypothetical protein
MGTAKPCRWQDRSKSLDQQILLPCGSPCGRMKQLDTANPWSRPQVRPTQVTAAAGALSKA